MTRREEVKMDQQEVEVSSVVLEGAEERREGATAAPTTLNWTSL